MLGNLAKVSEKSRKRSENLCSQGNLIVVDQQNAGNQTVV